MLIAEHVFPDVRAGIAQRAQAAFGPDRLALGERLEGRLHRVFCPGQIAIAPNALGVLLDREVAGRVVTGRSRRLRSVAATAVVSPPYCPLPQPTTKSIVSPALTDAVRLQAASLPCP